MGSWCYQRMACMKLGSKSGAFSREGQTWYVYMHIHISKRFICCSLCILHVKISSGFFFFLCFFFINALPLVLGFVGKWATLFVCFSYFFFIVHAIYIYLCIFWSAIHWVFPLSSCALICGVFSWQCMHAFLVLIHGGGTTSLFLYAHQNDIPINEYKYVFVCMPCSEGIRSLVICVSVNAYANTCN